MAKMAKCPWCPMFTHQWTQFPHISVKNSSLNFIWPSFYMQIHHSHIRPKLRLNPLDRHPTPQSCLITEKMQKRYNYSQIYVLRK